MHNIDEVCIQTHNIGNESAARLSDIFRRMDAVYRQAEVRALGDDEWNRRMKLGPCAWDRGGAVMYIGEQIFNLVFNHVADNPVIAGCSGTIGKCPRR